MSTHSGLRASERETLLAIAQTAIPAGQKLPGADQRTVERAEAYYAALPAGHKAGLRAMLVAIDAACVARTLSRFSSLGPTRRLEVLEALQESETTRLVVRALLATIKFVHFATPDAYAAMGCRFSVPPPTRVEKPRWASQISPAGALEDNAEIECDVVVVGTGAGGAPVAAELAARGYAVLLLEEGDHHDRAAFNGRPIEMMNKLYRSAGLTMSYGNTAIPIPVGRAVGGTTLVNSGTCFRPPADVLRGWAADGLVDLAPEKLAPYVDRVWDELQVGPSSRSAIGAVGEVIARGCDALGWSHQPLDRNAPGCDGQGLCCFGCPTDAKRSTNVSWVPKALERGAQLMTGIKVHTVLVERDRAVGVVGRAKTEDGKNIQVTVRASVVALACGTLSTPDLLLRNQLCNASGELGKNLSIHPASTAIALMDHPVDAWNAVPQGYAINEFHDEGILFEGGSVPLELTATVMPGVGPSFVNLMEQFRRMAGFGFMVRDTSRGRVRAGVDGAPSITYWLEDRDLKKMRRGLGLLSRVFFAAGAREVISPVAGMSRLRSLRDVEALENSSFAARHLDMSAYHPLGTARMGVDPFRSVVNADHEAHDVLNLFICDGAAVPGPPGVNPQVTIMSLALRAADRIARRLERLQAQASRASMRDAERPTHLASSMERHAAQ